MLNAFSISGARTCAELMPVSVHGGGPPEGRSISGPGTSERLSLSSQAANGQYEALHASFDPDQLIPGIVISSMPVTGNSE